MNKNHKSQNHWYKKKIIMIQKNVFVFVEKTKINKLLGYNVLMKENAEDQAGIIFNAVGLEMLILNNYKVSTIYVCIVNEEVMSQIFLQMVINE